MLHPADFSPVEGKSNHYRHPALGMCALREGMTVEAFIDSIENPPTPIPSPAEIRKAAFKALPERADLVTRLKTATPAEIDTWLTNNVTNLAQARTVLGAILKYLATMNGD